MTTIEVSFLAQEQESELIQTLRNWEKQRLVRLKVTDSPGLPSKPYTIEELDALLEAAEKSRSFTKEEAKVYLGL